MVLVFFGRIGDSVPGDSVPEFLVQQDKKDDVKAGMCNIMSIHTVMFACTHTRFG